MVLASTRGDTTIDELAQMLHKIIEVMVPEVAAMSIVKPDTTVLQHLHKEIPALLTSVKDSQHNIQFENDATTAFTTVKESLAQASLPFHPKLDAATNIMTDASDVAMGAILQLCIYDQWHLFSLSNHSLFHFLLLLRS